MIWGGGLFLGDRGERSFSSLNDMGHGRYFQGISISQRSSGYGSINLEFTSSLDQKFSFFPIENCLVKERGYSLFYSAVVFFSLAYEI